jgi:hypothetical protein
MNGKLTRETVQRVRPGLTPNHGETIPTVRIPR